jgi:uncharacterized protein
MAGSKAFGCVANTIRLRSGLYFDLADPKPDQFAFSDIAGALSKICRFGGQIADFYSVAEHCFHCCEVARQDGQCLDTQIAVLMHDAAEAFCGDVVKPLKVMLDEFAEVERRVEAAIAEKFLIDFDRESAYIREVDQAMLIAERNALFRADGVVWTGEETARPLAVAVKTRAPHEAESKFTSLARSIGIETE